MRYNIVHVDNDPKYLVTFAGYVNSINELNRDSPEKPTFFLASFEDPNECLSHMISDNDVDLCVLDLSMSKHPSLNGFGLVETIKLFCPSTNCLILTSNMAKSVVVEAAKAGCSGLMRKTSLRTSNKRVSLFDQIEYVCMHSRNFLKSNSQDRHNFSHTIAHILKGVLFEHEIIVDNARAVLLSNAKNITDSFIGFETIGESLKRLSNNYIETGRQLEKVLNFHTKRQISPSLCSLSTEILTVADNPQFEGIIEFIDNTDNSDAYIDPTLFRVALNNLLENSCKFSEGVPSARNKNIEVSLEYVENHDSFVVEVRDFGIGVPENEISTVVNPNVYGSNSKKGLASFGIGLSDVRKIVRLHRNKHLSGNLELIIPADKIGNIARIEIPKTALIEKFTEDDEKKPKHF